MSLRRVFLLFLPLSLLFPGVASAAEWTGNLNAFLGAKALDEDDWTADEHGEIGVRFDFRQQAWPINFAADAHFSEGDFRGNVFFPGVGVLYYEEDVETSEINLGVRKYWSSASNMQPFLGGGLAYVTLDAKGNVGGGQRFSDSGDGFGFWMNGGIVWNFNAFNVGFDLRYTQADVDLDVGDFEGGGGHAGMLLGYSW